MVLIAYNDYQMCPYTDKIYISQFHEESTFLKLLLLINSYTSKAHKKFKLRITTFFYQLILLFKKMFHLNLNLCQADANTVSDIPLSQNLK